MHVVMVVEVTLLSDSIIAQDMVCSLPLELTLAGRGVGISCIIGMDGSLVQCGRWVEDIPWLSVEVDRKSIPGQSCENDASFCQSCTNVDVV